VRQDRRRVLLVSLVCAALIAITLVSFAGVLRNGFVNYDDPVYVTDNPQVQSGLGWRTAAWAFTATRAANWHPLTWLSHLLDVTLFGLAPAGHHAVSLAIHAVNAGALFLVLRGLTGALWPSALAAALFALHPLRVESVAWVAERKDVLSAFFWIAALAAYRRYLARPTPQRYLTVFAALALGLAAKPMLVTLPLALLLLDYWPLGRVRTGQLGRLLLEKAPLLALAAASCFVTYSVQARGGAVALEETAPIVQRLENGIGSYLRYLEQTLWPRGLAVFYPLETGQGRIREAALAGVLLIALTGCALWLLRRSPYLGVGWFWYLGTLVPVLGLVQVGLQARADRYTYLPSIGVSIAVAWGAWALAGRSRSRRAWLAAGSCAALLGLSLATRAQVSHWRDTVTLFRQALAVAPESLLAHHNLGIALSQRGDMAGAMSHFKRALAIDPLHPQAHYNVGIAYDQLGERAEAVPHYRLAVQVKPDYAEAHNNLGVDLALAGRLQEAIDQFREARRADPALPGVEENLARVLAQQKVWAR